MTEVRALRSARNRSVMTWVPVRGDDGRVRMEMRWHVGQAPGRTAGNAA